MAPLYRGMDRSSLDIAYNNVKAEPDYQATMSRFKDLSDAIYGSVEVRREISYGDRQRQKFDWLSCGKDDAPTFVFVHGGYWQNYAKEDLAFVARGPLGRGFNVALAEYTLAPAASMTEIVGEIQSLLDALQRGVGGVGFAGRPVCLCGHSAGGQLAMLHRGHPAATLIVAISALFDLEPIALSWLNDKLRLTQQEILDYSPLRQIGRGAPVLMSVWTSELPELVRQSMEYSAACRSRGEAVTFLQLPQQTHFSILDDLADSYGTHMTAIVEAMGP